MRPLSGDGGYWARRRRALRPEERINNATLEQEKVNEILAKQNARYDAMTEEERQRYYMKPSLLTKIKKALRGQ